MLVHTSVYTTSTPRSAGAGSWPTEKPVPLPRRLAARSSTASGGSYPGGDTMRRSMPLIAAAYSHEVQTLFPSPMYATRAPATLPVTSRTVIRSASS